MFIYGEKQALKVLSGEHDCDGYYFTMLPIRLLDQKMSLTIQIAFSKGSSDTGRSGIQLEKSTANMEFVYFA
jgi:hypothetical protein